MRAIDQITQAFGYHTDSTFEVRRYAHEVYKTDSSLYSYCWYSMLLPEAHEINRLNVLGYLPLVGAWTGVERLISGVFLPKGSPDTGNIRAFKITFMCRGVCEILGIGVLFLIIDIIVSIGRLVHSCFSNYQEN